MGTIRYRKSASSGKKLQSNARILRWSDGSLTLQLASSPLEQHQLTAKALAAPQINPTIPTPTSQVVPKLPANSTKYNAAMDSHEYLAAPHEHIGVLRHTNQFTTALTVQSTDQDDEAIVRLRESLAIATRGNKATADGPEVIDIKEDPELAKKRAELAEKEKNKLQRRLALQRERESNRANNVLRRSGLSRGMGNGLTVGGLEDDGLPRRSQAGKKGPRKPRRRNSEYSEDEDMYGRSGRTKEDDYDEDDGFLVRSDEDVEEDGGASDEDDEEDLDAEGEDDEEVEAPAETRKEPSSSAAAGAGGGRHQRRRVVDDEDEE